MLKYTLFFFVTIVLLVGFSLNFLNNFENVKEQTLTKYQLQTKITAIFLKENIKKYLQNKDMQILNVINNVFNDDFNSISIENATFTITEKELIKLANNLDKKLAWELTNFTIDDSLGQIVVSTQSDDLQKELLTIDGSIPNELNKNIVPSSDIYTFIPSKKFRGISTLLIKFDATNQFDKTISSSAEICFDKNISSFTNNQNEHLAPKWFKDLVPISMDEETNNVNNSLQKDAIFYINPNIEKIYFEIYEKAKEEFFSNLLWFFICICSLFALGFLYKFIRKS